MSNPTLYQTNPNLSPDTVAMMVEKEMLVPVEPDCRSLADALHHELCKSNHIDGCSYYYHQWGDELPDWHPKHEWLAKAKTVFGAGIGGDE